MQRAEVAVIGSGPAGAITACLLAEAGRDVLLIEEGPDLPPDSCAFSRDEMVAKYRHGGMTGALGANRIAYVEGCCVGGGSEINSALYHRTPPEILDAWRHDFQVDALGLEDLVPHFEANEREIGVGGLDEPPAAPAVMLRQGAQALGWRSADVPRCFRYEPVNGHSRGTRQSMSRTFLPRAFRAGCRLLPETRVLRLVPQGSGWRITAVTEGDAAGGRPATIQAGSVFLCAGAIQTPALLQRSGLGRHAGASLAVHPTIKVVARFKTVVNTPGMGVPFHQVKEFAPRYTFGCSISSLPYLALAMTEHPAHSASVLSHWTHCAVYYAAISPEGRGHVRALPGFRDPLVRYSLMPADLATLGEALRGLCRLLLEAGAVAVYPGLSGAPEISSTRQLEALPASLPSGRASLMTIHLFSSCPMGEDRNRCAVDSFGRVHGTKGLYISDASVLCGPPGVNPQGSIMAVARRNGLKFLDAI